MGVPSGRFGDAGRDTSDRHGKVQPTRPICGEIQGQLGLRQANRGVCWRWWPLPRADPSNMQVGLVYWRIMATDSSCTDVYPFVWRFMFRRALNGDDIFQINLDAIVKTARCS